MLLAVLNRSSDRHVFLYATVSHAVIGCLNVRERKKRMRPDHLFSGFLSLALFLALPANASEGIDIVGSSTVYPFSTVAAERFAQITGGRSPKVESTGSGGGLALFCAGYGEKTPDITNASRRIKKSEQKLCAENGVSKVLEVKIGYDGIVIAQSIQGAAFALTRRELFSCLGA